MWGPVIMKGTRESTRKSLCGDGSGLCLDFDGGDTNLSLG